MNIVKINGVPLRVAETFPGIIVSMDIVEEL